MGRLIITTQPVIFIGRDYAINDVLDEIAGALDQRGWRVIRGWAAEPPEITEYPEAEWSELFGETDVAMITVRTRLPGALLERAPRLRGVVFPTIGTDSLDLADAKRLDIIVANGATSENFETMGESTVMLMAALFLDLHAKERITRENLPRPSLSDLKARMMRGRTIGLIGMGRIARAVVKRLQGWDVRILAHDPYVSPQAAPAGVQMVDMTTLLSESDLVSIHVTLTSETRQMIGRAELALMKPSAFLINTARGGAIDDDILIEALRSGKIAGAGLDVFGSEPLDPQSPLRSLPNVIVTSHMVGHTADMKDAFVAAGIENVVRIMRGDDPLYVRNPDVLPAWRRRIATLDQRSHDGTNQFVAGEPGKGAVSTETDRASNG